MTEVTAAIVVALLSLIGNCLTSWLAHRKSTALVTYRLEQLEKKVEKHNNVVERVTTMESNVTNMSKDLDKIKERVWPND